MKTTLARVLWSCPNSPFKLGQDQDGDLGLYGASDELLYYLDVDSAGALEGIASALRFLFDTGYGPAVLDLESVPPVLKLRGPSHED